MRALREGRLVRVISRSFTVDLGGERAEAVVPKRLRYLSPDLVDPVAVGDRVLVALDGSRPVITEVFARRNALSRPASGRRGKRQILAANLDVVVVVMATVDPPLKTGAIDRYLVLASAGGAPSLICVNKVDLVPPTPYLESLGVYRDLGWPVLFTSATAGQGIEALAAALRGKTGVLVGPSGVGKSSLINALLPGVDARTAAISARTGKGTHTTTWVELWELPGGGNLIDSPGLRVLDLSGLEPDRLIAHFPDLGSHARGCRFSDCRHLHEPGCAVKEAVERGDVAVFRYDSFRRIRDSLLAGLG